MKTSHGDNLASETWRLRGVTFTSPVVPALSLLNRRCGSMLSRFSLFTEAVNVKLMGEEKRCEFVCETNYLTQDIYKAEKKTCQKYDNLEM